LLVRWANALEVVDEALIRNGRGERKGKQEALIFSGQAPNSAHLRLPPRIARP
jgi:hypothetical protein